MRRREWKKAFRVLSVLPVPFLALIIFFVLFSGSGEVKLSGDEIGKDLQDLPTLDGQTVEPKNLPTLESYTDVVDKNVFSSTRERPTVRYTPVGSSGSGSTSSSDYVLVGVVLAGTSQNSSAVIRNGGKGAKTKSYSTGDDIDNMVVEEIMYDRVVLRQGDKETILELKPRDDEKTAAPRKLKASPKNKSRESKRKARPKD